MTESIGEVAERRIVVTESAARRIAALRSRSRRKRHFCASRFRAAAAPGSSTGSASTTRATRTMSCSSATASGVVVDEVSLDLLNGAEIDFVEDLMGASFQIRNPNAASSCGCGNSFSIA